MVNKAKKVSINALEKATKENYKTFDTVEWNGLEVTIKKNLGLDEMRVFVDNATRSCFSEADDIYTPENKDFAIRAIAIELYTNLSMPSDIRKRYDLLYASDIWQEVLSHIDREQFDGVVTAINNKIENMADEKISLINKQASELYRSVENIQEQLSSLFNGISADDIKNLVGAIARSGIDEEKLIRAYISSRKEQEKDAEDIS